MDETMEITTTENLNTPNYDRMVGMAVGMVLVPACYYLGRGAAALFFKIKDRQDAKDIQEITK
jgi:hypothetical protein